MQKRTSKFRWMKRIKLSVGVAVSALFLSGTADATDDPEKWELKFGFIKLTDITVPLRALYRAEFATQDVTLRSGKEYGTEYAL